MTDGLLVLNQASADTFRTDCRRNLRPETIQHLNREELVELQAALGFGAEWGCPVIPLAWVSPGHKQAEGARRMDFHRSLKASVSEEELEQAKLAVTRFALLHWLVPRKAGRSMLPTVATWGAHLRKTLRLANRALGKPMEASLFQRLDLSDFEIVYRDRAESAAKAWRELQERGLFYDTPSFETISKPGLEHDRKGEKPAESAVPSGRQFTPFPDDFIAELGWRVAWFVEEAGPVLVECAEKMFAVNNGAEHAQRTEIARYQRLQDARTAVVVAHDWSSVFDLPFEIRFTNKRGTNLQWPPRTPGAVKGFLSILQSCHLVALLLSFGSRGGEIHSMRRDALVEGGEVDRADGRTYKLVFNEAGALRDWPLPDLAVHTIKSQERLAAVMKTEGRRLSPSAAAGDNLWVRFGHGEKGTVLGDELRTPASGLVRSLVEYLGLEKLVGADSRIHSHRFRKTLARLVALAVAGAPKILMDLFGHKTIEMTLSYILADKALRAEVEEVAQAQTIMLAEHVIENADHNGGPAAPPIARAVAVAKARKGEDVFGAQDVRELAEILTLGGRTFQLVRPGVVCTKQVQQAGACNKKVGRPEPSRCRSACSYRLEDAANRVDVDGAIAESVSNYEKAKFNKDEIQEALWEGQIRTHLPRFDDLRIKWSQHPVVASLLAT